MLRFVGLALLLTACSPDHPNLRNRANPTGTTSSATTPTNTTPGTTSTTSTTSTDPGPSEYELCFQDIAVDPSEPAPDYDQFGLDVGSHCSGTDHQTITGVERVVFLGDSVTVGTPPTGQGNWYRNQLADELADRFGLQPPGTLWRSADIFEGTSLIQNSGDFSSCAKWGARTDDMLPGGYQLGDCFPEDERDKVTLVIMTVGGNDLQNLQEGFQDARPHDELWTEVDQMMAYHRESLEWLTDPANFPNGSYVVTTNLYEYTDASGDVTSCPGAALAGYEAIDDPELTNMVIHAMEEYVSVSVDTGTDMLFLLEHFCGHGYKRDDPDGRCYRGADAELWFDLTCIHPNAAGHDVITDMFLDVVDE